ncbi:MAG: alpha/beta hydrolase [Paracoccaceae bacterium]|nr:alpha/beta hydrolase [Paracoccaceae bacterium]
MKNIVLIFLLSLLIASMAPAQTRQEFSYGPDPRQRLDIYRPQNVVDAPILVMLHGGGWRGGDKRYAGVWRAKVANWVPQGYVFVAVNTRLLPQAGPIDQAVDFAAALAFIQQNAARFGANSNDMVVMGHSAGAHVAGLVATRNDIRMAAGLRPWAGTVLLDTAALNVPALMRGNPPALYQNAFGDDPAYWQAASPDLHLSADDGPFLLVCSSTRRSACLAAQSFERIASRFAVAATLLPQDRSHRQINIALGEDNAYTAMVENWMTSALR